MWCDILITVRSSFGPRIASGLERGKTKDVTMWITLNYDDVVEMGGYDTA